MLVDWLKPHKELEFINVKCKIFINIQKHKVILSNSLQQLNGGDLFILPKKFTLNIGVNKI